MVPRKPLEREITVSTKVNLQIKRLHFLSMFRLQDRFGSDLFQINGEGLITTRTNTLDREYAELHVILIEARDDADHTATGMLFSTD